MAIAHHPDISTLMTCAAGSHPESLSAVVASHLSVCPDCCRKVSQLSRIGVTLFERLEPIQLVEKMPRPDGLERAVPQTSRNPRTDRDLEIPAPLQCILGSSLDHLPWQTASKGIEQVVVALSPRTTGELRLLRIAPNATLRSSSRGFSQLLMVLRGSYSNDGFSFHPGDLNEVAEAAEHTIMANPVTGCIVLAASDREPFVLNNVLKPE
ncbi:MAG: hypothetical protein KJ587_11500 [Alphaproteobacteria bacterium]|nr:hypothetical protein [Alphaproteobacteria bacterium]